MTKPYIFAKHSQYLLVLLPVVLKLFALILTASQFISVLSVYLLWVAVSD